MKLWHRGSSGTEPALAPRKFRVTGLRYFIEQMFDTGVSFNSMAAAPALADAESVASCSKELIGLLFDFDPESAPAAHIPQLLVELERLRAVIDGAALPLLARSDAEGLHETDGLISTRSWLKHHTRASHDTALRRLKLARDLRSAPLLADSLRFGRISADAARIVCRARRPSTSDSFTAAEHMFTEWAETLHIDDLALAMRRWLELADLDGSDPERAWKDRGVWLTQTLGGSWNLKGRLTSEGGAQLQAALNQLVAATQAAERSAHLTDVESTARKDPQPDDLPSATNDSELFEPITPAQRAADALVDLAMHRTQAARTGSPDSTGSANSAHPPDNTGPANSAHPPDNTGPANSAHPPDNTGPANDTGSRPDSNSVLGRPAEQSANFTILIPVDDLRLGLGATTSDGAWIDGAAVARLACNATTRHAFTDAAGHILKVYSSGRHPSRALRNAVMAIYPTCVIPGCDVPSQSCDIHHLVEWHLGGATEPSNLVPLCARHHTLCHLQRWTIDVEDTDDPTTRPATDLGRSPNSRNPRVTVHRPGVSPLTAATRWRSRATPLDSEHQAPYLADAH